MSEREKILAHTNDPDILKFEVSTEREGPPPLGSHPIRRITIDFAVPVYLIDSDMQTLDQNVQIIAKRPENTPKGGTHWASGVGSRPVWNEPNEPTFDDSEFYIQTCARDLSPEEITKRQQRKRP